MRAADIDPDTRRKIPSEHVMCELVMPLAVLMHFAVDPHGKWGPTMEHFLFNTTTRRAITIQSAHPKASAMLQRTLAPECPADILTTASIN